MLILGIESSCDETSVALVEDGRHVRANYIASQVQLHARFGGVVPELASRAHIRRLIPMLEECLSDQGIGFDDIDAMAVTQGPGLIGALLIGVESAKSLAFAKKKPLIPVHHIAGHLYSPFLYGNQSNYRLIILDPEGRNPASDAPATAPASGSTADPVATPPEPLSYPYIGLVVSGGHSSLIRVDSPTSFKLLGETVDDAAGEAFDKLAKLLDLGYPGGPIIDRRARQGDKQRFELPRPMLHQPNFDFSFSGLKTAALQLARKIGLESFQKEPQLIDDLCASFQEAVVEVLLTKARHALERFKISQLAVVGGVACNGRLRQAAGEYLPHAHVVFPPPILCTDNAAMIAGLAYHKAQAHLGEADLRMDARADLVLGS